MRTSPRAHGLIVSQTTQQSRKTEAILAAARCHPDALHPLFIRPPNARPGCRIGSNQSDRSQWSVPSELAPRPAGSKNRLFRLIIT